MAEYTTNLNLKKPSLSEVADIADINGNMDILDGIAPKDTEIGAQSWSSKHILDMLCPEINETGNPVTCYPVKGYPLNVTASWEPTQEGSGDPSPDNIRPIKGRNSVTITHNGTAHTLTLPETIYGGSVGNDGAGKNEWKALKITGAEVGSDVTAQNGLLIYRIRIVDNRNEVDLKSNTLKALANWATMTDYSIEFQKGQYNNLTFYVPNMTGKADYQSWFTAHDTQVVYKLAEPATFTATGAAELTGLDGLNNILTDADSVTVKGAEDPKHTIAELKNAISTANETTTTAEEVAEGE